MNLARRYQSHSDSPLTAYGEAQVGALAWRLRRLRFDVALVSPVGRARATAALLAEAHPGLPCIDAPGWADVHHGRWEGLTYAEVQQRFPHEVHARFAQGIEGKAEGGESLRDVIQRVQAAWADLLQRYPGGRVLVVTHATPIQLVLCTAMGLPPVQHWQWRIDLGSVTCLDVYAAGTIARMVNEVPRLPQSAPADEEA